MTTDTTNSQAASINTREFRELLGDLYKRTSFDYGRPNAEMKAIIDHIDAKLAQAREDGFEEGLKAPDSAYLQIVERAKKAESRLAEIQRGVEKLQGYDKARILVAYADVLALLQPQGQADTSGLPG